MAEQNTSWFLFAGTSHPELAGEVARSLGTQLGKVNIERFPDGEIGVQVLENVRGKDVFLLQSLARKPNEYLMELLIFMDALKRASVRSISALLPYYCYARQDRKEKGRVPIAAKLVANLLEKAGVARVLTMDFHTEQVQGFFDVPVDNLSARPLFIKMLRKKMRGEKLVIVSPDVGSNRLARGFAEDLQANLAIVDKRRIHASQIEAGALIGDVSGAHAVLVDDICSTGNTLVGAARVCREAGARFVSACISHGFSSAGAMSGGVIDQLFFTNSIPREEIKEDRLSFVSVADLFAETVRRLLKDESISSLFIS